jgi:hypothetical protein
MRERPGGPARLTTMRRTPLIALPLLLLLAVACGSDDTTTTASGGSSTTSTRVDAPSTTNPPPTSECSMSGVRIGQSEVKGVPDAVAAKRQAIIGAAAACDYDALAKLAGPQFNFTFGDSAGGPAAYWKQQEADDVQVMRLLVQVLNLPSVERKGGEAGDQVYVSWPSADQDQRTQADWDALKGVYTDEQVAAFQKDDLYTGYRAAITESGDWMYFVAGD